MTDEATREHMRRWQAGEEFHAGEDTDELDRRIDVLRTWISTSPENSARDAEALDWMFLGKFIEEAGEVVTAYIGVTGGNPRKGVHDSLDHVRQELLDVALSALVAYTHLTPGASPVGDLQVHTLGRMHRVGLQ